MTRHKGLLRSSIMIIVIKVRRTRPTGLAVDDGQGPDVSSQDVLVLVPLLHSTELRDECPSPILNQLRRGVHRPPHAIGVHPL